MGTEKGWVPAEEEKGEEAERGVDEGRARPTSMSFGIEVGVVGVVGDDVELFGVGHLQFASLSQVPSNPPSFKARSFAFVQTQHQPP